MPTDTLTPVPGDPEVVSAAGRTLASIAAEISATATRLRALATTNPGSSVQWTGTAAVRAHARAVTLPPKLDKAHVSYADAGASLTRYAHALAASQAESRAAVRAANAAEIDLATADTARRQAATSDAAQAAAAVAASKPVPPPTAPRYDAAITDAQARIRRAVDANQAAHDHRRAAAKAAAAALHVASRAGIANRKWWQHALSTATHWVSAAWTDSLRFVSKTATAISALAGIAALVVAVVGIFCPPLEVAAAALEDLSLAAASIAAVADLALAITGKGSWTTVGWDTLSFAPAGASKLVRKLTPAVRKLRLFKPSTVAHASTGVRAFPPATRVLATPKVSSEKLQNLIDDLYKGTTNPARVGNGTTADAIRHELASGNLTHGRRHIMKGEEYLNGLLKWLKTNRTAPAQDQVIARSIADDLRAALRGE